LSIDIHRNRDVRYLRTEATVLSSAPA
jgi:hypothetical protein